MLDKVISIPDSVRTKNSGQESLAEGIKELQERIEAEKEDLSAQQLVLDESNRVAFPGFPYEFEATNKKIIVSIDIFKSGYECKVCKGLKRIDVMCSCERDGHPGHQHHVDDLAEVRSSIGESAFNARLELKCKECQGDYPSKRQRVVCSTCKGVGATLVLPETSKNLPTTGVVISVGPRIKMQKLRPWWKFWAGSYLSKKTIYGYSLGDRVLFGPYSGTMVPTKAGILFKILDATAPMTVVYGADDMGQFDFVLQDSD